MSREAMKQALEALEQYYGYMEPLTTVFGGPRVPAEQSTTGKVEKAITALRQALEQPDDEPFGYVSLHTNGTAYFNQTLAGVYRDTAVEIKAVYTRPQPAAQEVMSVQEVWEAAGGNPGVKATKQETLYTLKLLDKVCDEADQPAAQWVEVECPLCGDMAVAHTHPVLKKPAAQWVGLTDDEIIEAYETSGHKQTIRPQDVFAVASLSRAIEAKLKEKNR